jgi:hypothetical protein
VSVEDDDLEELASEIRRLIASNKAFLDRVNDEECEVDGDDDDEADDPESEEGAEDYEEL